MGASLRLAAEFFSGCEPIVNGVTHLLFLYREASDARTHFGLTTHGLCTVLEGLVREIIAKRGLADNRECVVPRADAGEMLLDGFDEDVAFGVGIVLRLVGKDVAHRHGADFSAEELWFYPREPVADALAIGEGHEEYPPPRARTAFIACSVSFA